MVLRTHSQSWNVLRNSRIVRQRKDSYIALRNTRIAQIPTSRGTDILDNWVLSSWRGLIESYISSNTAVDNLYIVGMYEMLLWFQVSLEGYGKVHVYTG